MRILTRYVLTDVLKVLVVTLVAMTALMMIGGLAREAYRNGLGIVSVLELFPFMLPEMLRFTAPGAMLLATTAVYGRMSGANEFVAVKSLGVSPLALVWPTLALATLVSLATVWLNDVAMSWGHAGVKRVITASVEDMVYSVLRTKGSYSTPQITINVRGVEGHRLIEPVFIGSASEGREGINASALEAELSANPEEGTLTVKFLDFDGTFRDQSGTHPGWFSVQWQLSDFSRGGASLGPADTPLSSIPTEIARRQRDLESLKQELAARAAYQMIQGDISALTGKEWKRGQTRLAKIESDLNKLHTEPHRRWSSGFSCFCFALVGAPLAIRMRNSDMLASFFACFLPILLIYYPLLMIGLDSAKHGVTPPQIVWLGNALMAVLGAWLLRRAARY